MTYFSASLAIQAAYAFAGLVCLYFAYKLFYVNTEKQGKVHLQLGKDKKLTVADLSPGIFFAALGTVILVYAIVYSPTRSEETGLRIHTVAKPVPPPLDLPEPVAAAPR